ncbi:MAG TPA: hypothetical protein VIF64_09700 [Pyrinomonadaceae bacterium]|jgi:hypothetical protein
MNTNRLLTRVIAFALASAICFVVSYLAARILLVLNNGFGAGDLTAFVLWTIFFAMSLLLPAALFAILLRNVRTINRVWIGILFGGLAGFGWTALNLWFLGPWFGAWSFNVLFCWIAGGTFGMLGVALSGPSARSVGDRRL